MTKERKAGALEAEAGWEESYGAVSHSSELILKPSLSLKIHGPYILLRNASMLLLLTLGLCFKLFSSGEF